MSVAVARQAEYEAAPHWHGPIAAKQTGFDLSAVLDLSPNLSEQNLEALQALSVPELANKLRLKWSDIKNWYTPVADHLKRKKRASGKKRSQTEFLESLESTVEDLTAETDSDIRIADSIESLAKSAQIEALVQLGKNQEIMTSPQRKKFRDKIDSFLDSLD